MTNSMQSQVVLALLLDDFIIQEEKSLHDLFKI